MQQRGAGHGQSRDTQPPQVGSLLKPAVVPPQQLGLGLQAGSHGEFPGPRLQQQPDWSQRQGIDEISIEEGFARFFILQGVTGRLRQFGYNFFDVQFSGFPPVMDMPVGPDYVLGPDDTLAIHIWNVPDPKLNRSYITPVERDGTLFIPQVGSIPIAGLTFSQASKVLKARLGRLLKRFDMHVSMARLRTIKVYVVGEVIRPGAYEISSLATASHALYAACGPAKSGSLRHIRIVRDGKLVSELDFYRFFLLGDRSQDVRLQSGDTLLVPPIGPVAAIGGPVKRPAIYELKNQTSLTQLVKLAGGLAPTADRRRAQIFRVEAGIGRVIRDVNLMGLFDKTNSPKRNKRANKSGPIDPPIQDGDFIRIASVPTQIENAVFLAGAVRNPGPYEFRPGMRLKDLLTPEQMLIDSYLDQAELVRTHPVSYEVTVIPFSPSALFSGTEDNPPLRRLDKVLVGTQLKLSRTVNLVGEVKRSGIYTLQHGERLSSVLKRAGGFTPNAFPPGIVLVRESVKRQQQIEIRRFVATARQQLAAESAAVAAGRAEVVAQGAASNSEQQVLALRLSQLDAAVSRVELGRVVVQLESIAQLEGTEDDVRLEGGDHITIPQPPQTVSVIGAVKTPSNLVYRSGLSLEGYLQHAGGPTKDADRDETYVVRASGYTDSAYLGLKDIEPGDTIVVPTKVEAKTPQLLLWQSVASIVGSLALTAAGISVIATN